MMNYFYCDMPIPFLETLLILATAALCIGLLTRIAALGCALCLVVYCFQASGITRDFILLQIIEAIALSLLGAGAYSLDAKLFGRRVIILDN